MKNSDPSNTVVTVKTLKVFWLKASMTIFPSVTLKIKECGKGTPKSLFQLIDNVMAHLLLQCE